LKDTGVDTLNMSNIAARQELRDVMKTLNLPNVEVEF
jgi:chromosome partitioning protein